MIVAYHPGAGGNRYLQYLLGNEWQQLNRSYDENNLSQQFQYRYLTNTVSQPLTDYTLTHCMNGPKIQRSLKSIPIVFIKSDLKTSLRREWVLHGHQRYLNKNIKLAISRLEHYIAIKDPSWPTLTSEAELMYLSDDIKKEVNADYERIVNSRLEVPGQLKALTQNLIDKINSAYEIICWHRQYYQQYPVDFSVAERVIDIDISDDQFAALMRKELSLYHCELFDQVWDAVNEQ